MPSLFSQARSLDAAGDAGGAVFLYRKAIAGGLSAGQRHTALVSLGWCLAAAGNDGGALRTLVRARGEFPRDPAIILFIALLQARRGKQVLAIRQLADGLLKESKSKRLGPFRKRLFREFHALRG